MPSEYGLGDTRCFSDPNLLLVVDGGKRKRQFISDLCDSFDTRVFGRWRTPFSVADINYPFHIYQEGNTERPIPKRGLEVQGEPGGDSTTTASTNRD